MEVSIWMLGLILIDVSETNTVISSAAILLAHSRLIEPSEHAWNAGADLIGIGCAGRGYLRCLLVLTFSFGLVIVSGGRGWQFRSYIASSCFPTAFGWR